MRLSYANVTSTLALVVAVSGGAYAVTALPTGSVGTAQLKTYAVTAPKIYPHTVGTGQLSAPVLKALGRGALASGHVAGTTVSSANGAAVTVTNPSAGIYCLAVAGVSQTSHVLVATPDYFSDSTSFGSGVQAFVESNAGCPSSAGRFAVKTYIRNSSGLLPSNEPFTYVIN